MGLFSSGQSAAEIIAQQKAAAKAETEALATQTASEEATAEAQAQKEYEQSESKRQALLGSVSSQDANSRKRYLKTA